MHEEGITSGTSAQCEVAFKSSGICAGYSQSNKTPYVLRLKNIEKWIE